MKNLQQKIIATALCSSFFATVLSYADALEDAVNATHRTPNFVARDIYRHPVETLQFFELNPTLTVVEIAPGAGWYTEILAPLLKEKGVYYAAHFPADSQAAYHVNSLKTFKEKLANNPSVYASVQLTEFLPPQKLAIAPANSADRVLTFRNVHNWYMAGGDEAVEAAFKAMFTALKPGGILGVVEHRLPASRPQSDQEKSGYMHEEYVVRLAKKAGFVLEAQSIINANPKDTAYHPQGVWTLPPSLRLGEKDRERYLAIGESDRMTLKFRKPE